MKGVILDALLDTAKVLPLLLVVYFLIEFVEFRYALKIQNNKLLRGKYSPIFGAVSGCIPQCGFSVISTDLFSKKTISIGALIAVFIATSDEAIPIMLSNFNKSTFMWLLILLAIKIVFAIMVGYLSNWLSKLVLKKGCVDTRLDVSKREDHIGHDTEVESSKSQHEEHSEETVHSGCCHHHVESKTYDWKHPLFHSLKIALFILIVNFIFGVITKLWIGEERLMSFLETGKYFQPLLAVFIGLIPNCASSVVLTELFIEGGLKFGALVAGLSVNAGLGMVMLFKQNKNIKENLFVIGMTVVPSIVLGYCLLFI